MIFTKRGVPAASPSGCSVPTCGSHSCGAAMHNRCWSLRYGRLDTGREKVPSRFQLWSRRDHRPLGVRWATAYWGGQIAAVQSCHCGHRTVSLLVGSVRQSRLARPVRVWLAVETHLHRGIFAPQSNCDQHGVLLVVCQHARLDADSIVLLGRTQVGIEQQAGKRQPRQARCYDHPSHDRVSPTATFRNFVPDVVVYQPVSSRQRTFSRDCRVMRVIPEKKSQLLWRWLTAYCHRGLVDSSLHRTHRTDFATQSLLTGFPQQQVEIL